MYDMTEKERKDAKMATLYELRLIFATARKLNILKMRLWNFLIKSLWPKNKNNTLPQKNT